MKARTGWSHAVVAGSLALLVGQPAQADEIVVAVAANFAAPMARLAEAFTAATGHTLKLASGSTGKFYSQIVSGAPFEVLLSADDTTPKRLIAEGHAVAGSAFTYAVGQLVLWSATPGLVDAQGAVLASGHFQKIAIASPKTAPYGRAAMEVLVALGLEGPLSLKLVTGESVAQAYQFVATGNAELGFVALSQVSVPGKAPVGSMWRVPASLHAPMRQDAVLLKAGAGKPAAAALLQWLRTEPAQAVIQSYGYVRG